MLSLLLRKETLKRILNGNKNEKEAAINRETISGWKINLLLKGLCILKS